MNDREMRKAKKADDLVGRIYRSVPCVACSMIWCGHPGCARYSYVRDMYDWYPEKQAYRLKPEYRHLEPDNKKP